MNSHAQLNAIALLDLDPIKVKLMHKESGEGWSRAEADAVEFEYRRFLSLMKLFPQEQVAPRFDVDIFWHYHILDTMKYAEDCQNIFGYFLHHFPYTGLRGAEDETLHRDVGARMQQLYEETFGEAFDRRGGAQAKTAWSQPTAPQTAWSQPTAPLMAWSQPTAPLMAWSQPTAPLMAWSQPTAPAATAWSQPTIAMNNGPLAAQNDRLYARPSLTQAA